MTLLERSVWGATYARSFHFFLEKATEAVATILAIKAADRAVKALRQETAIGQLHQDEDLELERLAEANILPENTSEIAAGPTHAGARVENLDVLPHNIKIEIGMLQSKVNLLNRVIDLAAKRVRSIENGGDAIDEGYLIQKRYEGWEEVKGE